MLGQIVPRFYHGSLSTESFTLFQYEQHHYAAFIGSKLEVFRIDFGSGTDKAEFISVNEILIVPHRTVKVRV